MSIKQRLLLCFAIVVCAGGLTTFGLVKKATESQFRTFVFSGDADKAKVYAGILAEYYVEHSGWEGLQSFLSEMPAFLHTYGAINALLSDRITVADPQGRIVADTSGKLLGTTHPAMHLAQGVPIISDFKRIGTVLVGSMVDSTFTGANEQFLAQLVRSLTIAILVSTAIATLFGLALSIQITRPLAALDDAAKKIAGGDFSVIVPVNGKDEIASLSSSFNAMTGELRRLDEAKRRIIADSAHELRTPVTLIRGSLEAMIDGVFPMDLITVRSVYDETMRLSRLIDMLRELELIDSGELRLSLDDIDILPALEKAANLFRTQAGEKDVGIEVEDRGAAALAVRADALRFDEVLYNLIENAIKYSPRGGKVGLAARREGPSVLISVDDSGPGIPPLERERVFERFYRMDKSRAQDLGGRGFGLSIAYEIVKAHGGSIHIEDSKIGGASFVVTLPVARRP
jgi:two-component system OmpR family sensor kinase/two-component system sensor histidine kinase BaeS